MWVTLIYFVGMLWTVRCISGAVAWEGISGAVAWEGYGEESYARTPDGEDWIMGIVIGFIASVAWPLVLPGFYLWEHPEWRRYGLLAKLARPPRRIRDAAKEEERKRLARQGELADRYAKGEISLKSFETSIEQQLKREAA